jgi:hypothetical protein
MKSCGGEKYGPNFKDSLAVPLVAKSGTFYALFQERKRAVAKYSHLNEPGLILII